MFRFDKRITEFAEEKFKRDGISVKLGAMVTKVTEKEIYTKDRATGTMVSMPSGLVVWSTGIGTRPVITEFMKQIGQVTNQAPHLNHYVHARVNQIFRISPPRLVTSDVYY